MNIVCTTFVCGLIGLFQGAPDMPTTAIPFYQQKKKHVLHEHLSSKKVVQHHHHHHSLR